MYCAVCISNGHSKRNCPNQIAWAVRTGLPTNGLKNRVIEVRDTDDGVKVVLKAHGVKPGTTKLENKKLLNDLANSMEPTQMIVFIR